MDSLQDWPEPIVRVQVLSDSGMTMIPDRYVKPLSERPSENPAAGMAARKLGIPVIDLGGLAEGAVDCPATVRAISDACREWGFFQVVNHGVSPALMAKTREVWRGFFHQPMEEKQMYANSPQTYEGYGSRLGVEKGAILDWGDFFFLYLLPESMKNHDKWPARPASCREITEEYGRELVPLCRTLMELLSISLGLEAGSLQKAFGGEENGASLRVNFYPKCPQPDLTLGLSAHSDPGGLTILLADDRVQGLQVRKGNAWVTVHPAPGAFIVNVGDQIQVISNATYKSVEHRVIPNRSQERISLAFFYNPKGDSLIGPTHELVTPHCPPLYKQITYSEYRGHLLKKGTSGKSQLESLQVV